MSGGRYIIGGGSKGLGQAVAEALAGDGGEVLLLARDGAGLDRAAERIGPGASTLAVDLADPSAAARIREAAAERWDRIDGLLLNSGGPPAGAALEMTDGDWTRAFELLLAGPIRILRELMPSFAEPASVLFVTSSSVRQTVPTLDASNVFRPALAGLSKTLALQHGPGLRFNCIVPGRFDTDRVRDLDRGLAESSGITVDQVRAAAEAALPMGRYGDPAELGAVGAFLLSDRASYVTGACVQVDGGMITALP